MAMLNNDLIIQYGFCDIVGESKNNEDPDDPDKDNDPDAGNDPDNDDPDNDDPDDDAKQQIRELQQQLYRQRQINQMLTGLNRPNVKKTLANAFEQFAVK